MDEEEKAASQVPRHTHDHAASSYRRCLANPLYEILPRGQWLVDADVCQRQEDFAFDAETQSLCWQRLRIERGTFTSRSLALPCPRLAACCR